MIKFSVWRAFLSATRRINFFLNNTSVFLSENILIEKSLLIDEYSRYSYFWSMSTEHVLVHWITNSDNIQDHNFYPVNVIAILSCEMLFILYVKAVCTVLARNVNTISYFFLTASVEASSSQFFF